jgi:hypothetical protein
VYYDRDVNPPPIPPVRTTFSDAKRTEFLQLFAPAPVETFDTATISNDIVTSTLLTSIGNITLSTIAGSGVSFQNSAAFTRAVRFQQSQDFVLIRFFVPVIAAGFYVFNLTTVGDYVISGSLNGQAGSTFIVPHIAPTDVSSLLGSVLYIGVVDLDGFNVLRFNKGTRDTIHIDNFSAFTSSQLIG